MNKSSGAAFLFTAGGIRTENGWQIDSDAEKNDHKTVNIRFGSM